MSSPALSLLRRTSCPHCWTVFAPEDILWISAHTDLLGDPRLGPEHPQRFLPSRFNIDGSALDARGFVCQSLACPRCHLPVPRALIEIEPTFISILGTPACGKSFYLTALTWEMRRLLGQSFGLSFTDADPVANRSLNQYEESLFLNPRGDGFQYLADLIRKTELQGELYDTVTFGNQTVSYPRPYLFTIQPQAHHPKFKQGSTVSKLLCLYDNAGEHFQPGRESTGSPVTQHLTQARLLLFLFDPTQDTRFQQLLHAKHPQAPPLSGRTSRQESVLIEAATRVRRSLGLSQGTRHNRPLVVVLTKCDAWIDLLEDKDLRDPWRTKDGLSGLERERIERRSAQARKLMMSVCPELVSAAEGFAQEVVYIPVSALGHSPRPGPKGPAMRPCDIKPIWVTVPLLYSMSRWMPGLVPGVRRAAGGVPTGTTPPASPAQTPPSTPTPGRSKLGGPVPDWLK
jgi:Double-GTPase 2